MNALKIVMDVHTHVLILLVATIALAAPSIAYQVMVVDV